MVSVNFKELQGRGTLLRCKDDFFKGENLSLRQSGSGKMGRKRRA